MLVAIAAALVVSGRVPGARSVVAIEPTPSPTEVAVPASPGATGMPSESPSPSAAVLGTPEGTPWPTPDPAIWRVEGRVTDREGTPLADVCVVIGPLDCRAGSPHTNADGRFFFDVPQNATIRYHLRFEKEGYVTERDRIKPSGPMFLEIVLEPAR